MLEKGWEDGPEICVSVGGPLWMAPFSDLILQTDKVISYRKKFVQVEICAEEKVRMISAN